MRFRTALAVVLFVATCSRCTTIRKTYSPFREGFASWLEAFWRDAFEDPARVDRIQAGVMTKQQVRRRLESNAEHPSLNHDIEMLVAMAEEAIPAQAAEANELASPMVLEAGETAAAAAPAQHVLLSGYQGIRGSNGSK